ncbi:hypothetical protein JCM5350_005085 [Sporobolomyces pararoseus]
MPSATVHSLPPELLRHVLALTQTQSMYELIWAGHLESIRNFKSFSLVHSSWTSVAEELLLEHLWFVRGAADVPKILEGIESPAFKTIPVRGLTLGAGAFISGSLFQPPSLSRWPQAVYVNLKLQRPETFGGAVEVDLKQLELLPTPPPFNTTALKETFLSYISLLSNVSHFWLEAPCQAVLEILSKIPPSVLLETLQINAADSPAAAYSQASKQLQRTLLSIATGEDGSQFHSKQLHLYGSPLVWARSLGQSNITWSSSSHPWKVQFPV